MPCVHLRQLFELCDENELRFSSSDLVHIVCKQCEKEEVCPSVLLDQFETDHAEAGSDEGESADESADNASS